MSPRIVHPALNGGDLERTTPFYRDVFGFTEVEVRDHTPRHLTDGTVAELGPTACYERRPDGAGNA